MYDGVGGGLGLELGVLLGLNTAELAVGVFEGLDNKEGEVMGDGDGDGSGVGEGVGITAASCVSHRCSSRL